MPNVRDKIRLTDEEQDQWVGEAADRLSAELKHGVLKLQIQKAEHAKPKRIEVQVT